MELEEGLDFLKFINKGQGPCGLYEKVIIKNGWAKLKLKG